MNMRATGQKLQTLNIKKEQSQGFRQVNHQSKPGFAQKAADDEEQRTRAIFGETDGCQIFKFCAEEGFN